MPRPRIVMAQLQLRREDGSIVTYDANPVDDQWIEVEERQEAEEVGPAVDGVVPTRPLFVTQLRSTCLQKKTERRFEGE